MRRISAKLMAANGKCGTTESIRQAFRSALDSIKPTDIVGVGMFQKHKNQVRKNADIVREILVKGKTAPR